MIEKIIHRAVRKYDTHNTVKLISNKDNTKQRHTLSAYATIWRKCAFYREPSVVIRPRERLGSIVVSMSVCVSVCLRAICTNFFVLVAYVRGSVLLRHVYDRPYRLLPVRGFLPN